MLLRVHLRNLQSRWHCHWERRRFRSVRDRRWGAHCDRQWDVLVRGSPRSCDSRSGAVGLPRVRVLRSADWSPGHVVARCLDLTDSFVTCPASVGEFTLRWSVRSTVTVMSGRICVLDDFLRKSPLGACSQRRLVVWTNHSFYFRIRHHVSRPGFVHDVTTDAVTSLRSLFILLLRAWSFFFCCLAWRL